MLPIIVGQYDIIFPERLSMRFKLKYPHGTTRLILRFLFLPRTIGDERRWLEWAYIFQKRHQVSGLGGWWQDLEFVDDFSIIKIVDKPS
jgi:hypothetical protein